MVTEKRDYYEVLEVERSASGEDIKRSYRQLVRKLHPDVNPGDHTAEERFKEVAEAYEVLSDDSKREMYDRFGHQAAGGGGPAGGQGFESGFGGFGDIFDILMNGGQSQSRTGPQRGHDQQTKVELTLEEAYRGVTKTIKFARIQTCDTCTGSGAAPGTKAETCTACHGSGQVRMQRNSMFGVVQQSVPCTRCGGRGRTIATPCTTCQGQGRVRRQRELEVEIPAGVESDMRMPIHGEGDAGTFGAGAGDLHVFFHVKDDPRFERHGRDLRSRLPITFVQAALGDEITVPTVSGEKAAVTIPEGTQTGTTFRLRGQGMPDVRNANVKGDLHVVVRIEVPTKLNDEEKKALRQFAALRGETAPLEQHKGFFGKLKEALAGHEE